MNYVMKIKKMKIIKNINGKQNKNKIQIHQEIYMNKTMTLNQKKKIMKLLIFGKYNMK